MAMFRRDDNLSRERDDCFIASTTAAIIAAIGAAGGMTAGAALSAHASGNAAKLQTDSANHGADLQKQSADQTLAFQRQQAEADWRNHEAAQKANYDQYLARYNAAKGLGASMNFALPDAKAYTGSEDPHYDTSQTPLTSTQTAPSGGSMPGATPTPPSAPGASGAGSAAELQALLKGGMDPQQAVMQFNKQYGRTTGNEAVYYDPSQHGGKATIGLPDAYLSLESGGWAVTPRSGGGGSTGAGTSAPLQDSVGSYLSMGAPTSTLQPPPSFRLPGVSSYLGGR